MQLQLGSNLFGNMSRLLCCFHFQKADAITSRIQNTPKIPTSIQRRISFNGGYYLLIDGNLPQNSTCRVRWNQKVLFFSLLKCYCLHLDLWTDRHRSFVCLEGQMELQNWDCLILVHIYQTSKKKTRKDDLCGSGPCFRKLDFYIV